MKNNNLHPSICVKPVDKDIELILKSVQILNSFKSLGYTNRSQFVEAVQKHSDEFIHYKKVSRLFDFWSGRVKDEELNTQLEYVLKLIEDEK